MKIICAGAPKTGTKSFSRALKILGYDTVYDIPEAVEFGFKQWEDVFYQKQPDLSVLFDTVYAKVDAVVDVPHSYFFDAFLERWPEAKVVLLLRDEEPWYASYKKMVDRGAKDYGNLVYFRYLFPSLNRMLNFFVHLLTGCVGWEPLCKFLGKPVPKDVFPHENTAADKHNISDLMMQDTWIAKKAAREIKILLAFIPVVVGLFIAYLYFYWL